MVEPNGKKGQKDILLKQVFGYSILPQQRVDNLMRRFHDSMLEGNPAKHLPQAVAILWEIYGELVGSMKDSKLDKDCRGAIEVAENATNNPTFLTSGEAKKRVRHAQHWLGVAVVKLNINGPHSIVRGVVSPETKMRNALLLTNTGHGQGEEADGD